MSIQLTIEQARKAAAEGVVFSPVRDDKYNLTGWVAGVHDGSKAFAPLGTFQWVPHEPSTWPWRYADLKVPTELRIWNGWDHQNKGLPEYTNKLLPIGTTVKVVMVSRLGDVGITDDLSAEHGYHRRIPFDEFDTVFTNCRATLSP